MQNGFFKNRNDDRFGSVNGHYRADEYYDVFHNLLAEYHNQTSRNQIQNEFNNFPCVFHKYLIAVSHALNA